MAKPKPKNRSQKYSGVLNEPMVFHYSPDSDSIFFDAKSQKEADRKTRAQWDERIAALYRHYQIERTSLAADFGLGYQAGV